MKVLLLEQKFKEEKLNLILTETSDGKAWCPMVLISLFLRCWDFLKSDVLSLLRDSH